MAHGKSLELAQLPKVEWKIKVKGKMVPYVPGPSTGGRKKERKALRRELIQLRKRQRQDLKKAIVETANPTEGLILKGSEKEAVPSTLLVKS